MYIFLAVIEVYSDRKRTWEHPILKGDHLSWNICGWKAPTNIHWRNDRIFVRNAFVQNEPFWLLSSVFQQNQRAVFVESRFLRLGIHLIWVCCGCVARRYFGKEFDLCSLRRAEPYDGLTQRIFPIVSYTRRLVDIPFQSNHHNHWKLLNDCHYLPTIERIRRAFYLNVRMGKEVV